MSKEDYLTKRSSNVLLALLVFSLILRVFDIASYQTLALEISLLILLFTEYIHVQNFYKEKDMRKKDNLADKIAYSFYKHLVFIMIYLFVAYWAIHDRSNDKEVFIKEDSFICKDSNNFQIHISKKDGWKLEGKYFVKERSKILSNKCQGVKNEE